MARRPPSFLLGLSLWRACTARDTPRRQALPLAARGAAVAAAFALLATRAAAVLAQLQQSQAQPTSPTPAAAVRDSLAAIFRHPEYSRTLRESTLDRFFGWVAHWLRALLQAVRGSRTAYWTTVTALAILIVAVVGRAAYLGYLRRERRAVARGVWPRLGPRGARDPWLLAQELAAQGNHTDAAHALYRALLEALARRERVRLHPSKTVGDYVRDLRQRSSSLFTRFRDFARSYETVVYGVGFCDPERYERLLALATPIVQPPPAAAEARRG